MKAGKPEWFVIRVLFHNQFFCSHDIVTFSFPHLLADLSLNFHRVLLWIFQDSSSGPCWIEAHVIFILISAQRMRHPVVVAAAAAESASVPFLLINRAVRNQFKSRENTEAMMIILVKNEK